MSWEDCGFKPGKIYGPPRCPRTCSDCDGEHHFYVQCLDACLDDDDEREELPEGLNPEMFFGCKHCDTKAEAVPDDDDFGVGDDLEQASGTDRRDGSDCDECGAPASLCDCHLKWGICPECGCATTGDRCGCKGDHAVGRQCT